ncbi:unnamed protein product [Rotaria sp. Silwood1]|nr:unnamed protein product [Rotaria sp. Silwood1]
MYNPSTGLNKKLNLSVTSSHSHTTQQTSSIVPDRKRPYNVSVDPARYRRVPDPDDANSVKFACSLCGNLYKWRKSLNKHWKEKHNDEEPPPLDAPVTIRPSKSSQSKTLNSNQIDMIPTQMKSVSTHHPAFPFNPYTWLKLATSITTNTSPSSSTTSSIDQHPLDLRIKPIENHNISEDDDGHESSDDRSSPSPQNSIGQKLFICSICDQRFLSIETVNEHFLKNHLHELENEITGKSPPRNTNVAQQNEEWNLSDPVNPLKCIQCDFVGRWPTELQKHAASHSTSRPFKCLICSLTYKWRWVSLATKGFWGGH